MTQFSRQQIFCSVRNVHTCKLLQFKMEFVWRLRFDSKLTCVVHIAIVSLKMVRCVWPAAANVSSSQQVISANISCFTYRRVFIRTQKYNTLNDAMSQNSIIVTLIGDNTVMGQIAKLASATSQTKTPIAIEISHFIHFITYVALALGLAFLIIGIAVGQVSRCLQKKPH